MPGRGIKIVGQRVVASRLIEKVAANEKLDEADLAYADAVLGAAEAKWVHQHQIAQKAVIILEGRDQARQLPPGSTEAKAEQTSESAARTTDDWFSHFWEDAGLVSDEMLQEVYARVLAGEASEHGPCAMRTLRTLRYLDRLTAERFSSVLAVAVNGGWVLDDQAWLKSRGISFGIVMDLDDAGLMSSAQARITEKAKPGIGAIVLRSGHKLVRVDGVDELVIGIFSLTTAGRELARVADVQHDEAAFEKLVSYLRGRAPAGKLSAAVLPRSDWQGQLGALSWEDVV